MPEKFNPSEYESYEDLSEEEKSNFKKVDDGFAKKEALSEEDARDHAENMQEKIANTIKIPDVWWKWLIVDSGFVIFFGLAMLLFNMSILKPLSRVCYNSFFQNAQFNSISAPELFFQQWLYGVLGAIMIGWGIMLLCIIYFSFRKLEKWSWYSITLSLVIWYLLDTAISVFYRVYINALLNTGFFIILGMPLLFSLKYFKNKFVSDN